MTVRICTAKYSDACRSSSMRLSVPMLVRFATYAEPFSLVTGSKFPRATIGELSVESTAQVVKKGDLQNPAQLIDLENVSAWGAISGVEEVASIGSNRLSFGNCDVLTSKLRPYLGKTIHNEFPDGIGTTEWIPLKVDADRFKPRLLGYLLQSSHYVEMSKEFMAGKEHPRINPDDILRLEIPVPPIPMQDDLVKALDELNAQCKALQESIGSELDIVDSYFSNRFGLDVPALNKEIEKQKRGLKLMNVAMNPDLRFSFKFHSPSVEFALKSLRRLTTKRLGDFLSEDIVLGASVSPNDYEATSEYIYFSMATIRTWSYSEESANQVSDLYFKANSAKSVKENDILMARSGEGTIGKVALIPNGVEGICSDFTMRIRVDAARCLPEFARFYFMSKYFQHVMYGEKKGLGNNTNIFPIQLRDLPFLDVPLKDQITIVEEIRALLTQHFKELEGIVALRKTMETVLTFGLTGKPYSNLLTPTVAKK
jgi:type I restriction enzyme S subunit